MPPGICPTPKHLAYDRSMGAHPTPGSDHSQAHFQSQDSAFVALVDGAFADPAKRSGPHLLCRAGCAQCCVGVFAIGPADALRLNQGLAALWHEDPQHAACVRERAATSWARLAPQFPGNATTGALELDPSGDPLEAFASARPSTLAKDMESASSASRPQHLRKSLKQRSRLPLKSAPVPSTRRP